MKQIEERIEIEWLINVSINDLIQSLQNIKENYPDAISLQIKDVWTGYEDVHHELVITRMETEKEYLDRIAKEKRDIVYTIEQEKAIKEKREKNKKAKIEKLRLEIEKLEKENV